VIPGALGTSELFRFFVIKKNRRSLLYGWPGNHILLCNFANALAWPFLEERED